MNIPKVILLLGIITLSVSEIFGQSQITPSPYPQTTPPVAPTATTTPNAPYNSPVPGSTTPYTTPPVMQQTQPPVAPTSTLTPAINPAASATVVPTITQPAVPVSPSITQPAISSPPH